MGLVDYISRNPYQPAKSISIYDEEFLVATLSRIHFDAKLLQQKQNISTNTLLKLYHKNECETQNSNKYNKQVSSIDFAKLQLLPKDYEPLALQSHSSKSLLKHNSNFVSDPAKRVHVTNNNSALATRKYRSNLLSFNINNPHSEHASRVPLIQNNR